jgi:hypothetical protein
MKPCRRLLPCLCSLLAVRAALGAEPQPADAAAEFFETKIRPVLVEHCHACHSAKAEKLKGELLLDSRAGLLKGGEDGPVVVPGDPDKSRLIQAVRYKNVDLQMPKRGRLPDAVIADLTTWVAMGAPWPGDGGTTTTLKKTFDLDQRQRDHWAWRPVRSVAPPAVKKADWPSGPIDRFVLAKLEGKGLAPAPDADPRTLVRRLHFDVIGLPPTPEEVEAFVQSATRNPQSAIEQEVDRLLASPHFGERWGRHWLDLVRYAESRGHEFDYTVPNAYQYRDYVIRALNADVPYHQFVTEHVAGDLLPKPRLNSVGDFNESILGTGFWFLGEELHSPVDIRQDEADRFDNRIDVLTKAFLGLTVSCARCHDHKFDAISTKDYYALAGFLQSSNYRLVRFDHWDHNRRVAAVLAAVRERARPIVHKALSESLKPTLSHLADYLLAASAMCQGGKPEEVAARAHLDAVLVGRWADELRRAAKEPADPFHLVAKAAMDPDPNRPGRVADLVRSFLADGQSRDRLVAAFRKRARRVIDYSSSKGDEWLPDDVSFGLAPARPGAVRLNADGSARLTENAAAEFDPLWGTEKLVLGAETDSGALNNAMRPGRTIRTPTFTLENAKVFYLVRGSGQAYFSVTSHHLIAGPLHARLVESMKAGSGYRWLGHDLTPYRGQRLHVEFTAESADFAVAAVIQSDRDPAPPVTDALLRQALVGCGTLDALAAAYQRLALELIERLATDKLAASSAVAEQARLANWLLARPGLLSADGKTPKALVDALATLVEEQATIAARIRPESRLAMAMQDGTPIDECVFNRGSYKTPGPLVPRRFLEALAGTEPLSIAHGSGRLELARQMTDPATNPFITRVIVNRIWHHLFGRGIVASVDNFGVLGEEPTHPELLDYLAGQFVRDGWSLKKAMRAMVLSRAYRMSSRPDEKAETADPNNLWLHRARVRRLEGEAIRDEILAVSGRLDRTMYGPSVPVHLTQFQDGRGRPASGPLDGAGRRSVYLAVRRNFLSPFLLAFDTPIPFSTVGRRTVSNVPAQALILLNDPFVHQQADVWAMRVLASRGTPQERVTGMYLSAFGRPPTEAELAACVTFLANQAQAIGTGNDDVRVWKDLAHTLVNVKEFIFVP